jgi:hypothetical protein
VVSFTLRLLYPWGKSPFTRWIGDRVDPRIGLVDVEKIKFLPPLRLELQPFGHRALSQSLYQLRSPDSCMIIIIIVFIIIIIIIIIIIVVET